jgi:hypothetical protein
MSDEHRLAVADIRQPTPPPPGWYDDGKGGERWWDGTAWTEARQPVSQPTEPELPKQISGVAVLGYGLAIFTPIIGFILGLALVAKGDRHGGGVVGASLAFGLLWIVLLIG